MKKRIQLSIIFLAGFLFLFTTTQLTAVANPALNTSGERPKVVTYMSVTEDWTRELLRNIEVDIEVLVSGNEDVHSYDPSSDAVLAMDGADLFVRLNIPIEAFADDIAAAFPSVPTVNLWVDTATDPLNGYDPRKDDVWNFTAPKNMHMWTSPSIAKNFVNRLAIGLKTSIGTTLLINQTIDANLASYQLSLDNTINWLNALKVTAPYQNLKLVPFHPAFLYYLEDDLSLERVAVIEQQPGIDPPISHLEDIYSVINDTCTIIWHPQESIGQTWAQTVSQETGANITMLTPLLPITTPSEWVGKFGASIDTFLEMVEFNTYQLVNSAPYSSSPPGGDAIPGFEIFIILGMIGVMSIGFILMRKNKIFSAK